MTLPRDPFMLLSTVNTLLRDEYASLAELCAAESQDMDSLRQTLSQAGFEYSEGLNQFR